MEMPFSYTVKRMRRRSLRLFITDTGEVMVYAPLRTDDRVIEEFVSRHEKWVEEHIEIIAGQRDALERHVETIRFTGRECRVVQDSVPAPVLTRDMCLVVPETTVQKERKLITDWYKRQAESLLTMRTQHWAEIMDLHPEKISISNARKRWGSCSSEGHVVYSWRLIAADRDEIDYVIIHELSHIRFLNHSRAFWELVERYCPLYRQSEKKLNDLARYLKVTGWSK